MIQELFKCDVPKPVIQIILQRKPSSLIQKTVLKKGSKKDTMEQTRLESKDTLYLIDAYCLEDIMNMLNSSAT